MAFNSTEIIQEIHKEFAHMFDYMTNEAAYQATADQIERGLFKQLLQQGVIEKCSCQSDRYGQ